MQSNGEIWAVRFENRGAKKSVPAGAGTDF
jgi:hypothetical protein